MPLYTMEDCEFELYQTTKVRVRTILKNGVEVRTKLNKIGFVPYCNLIAIKGTLIIGQALYVKFIGQDKNYLYFVEDSLIDPSLSPF